MRLRKTVWEAAEGGYDLGKHTLENKATKCLVMSRFYKHSTEPEIVHSAVRVIIKWMLDKDKNEFNLDPYRKDSAWILLEQTQMGWDWRGGLTAIVLPTKG